MWFLALPIFAIMSPAVAMIVNRPTALIAMGISDSGTTIEQSATSSSVTTTTTATSNSDTTPNSSSAVFISSIIPLVIILSVILVFIFMYRYRERIFRNGSLVLFNRRASDSRDGTGRSLRETSTRSLTAEELASVTPGSRRNLDRSTGRNVSTEAIAAEPGAGRRRRERTNSGRSVRTLPVYSKQPGDEEVVLARQRSSTSSADGLLGEAGSPTDDTPLVLPVSTPSDSLPHPLAQAEGQNLPEREETASRSVAAVHQSSDSPTSSALPSPPLRASSISQRGWGEAPSYVEAIATPRPFPTPHQPEERNAEGLPSSAYSTTNDPDGSAGIPVPRTPNSANATLRNIATTGFKDFLSRTGLTAGAGRNGWKQRGLGRDPAMRHSHSHSLTSLLLQPQTSRISQFPPTSYNDSTFGSLHSPSPWQSTSSLVISSPLPHTAVRASFDSSNLPRGGLSDLQMQFLNSSEALNLAGVRLDEAPIGRGRRRGASDATLLPTSITGSPNGRSDGEEGHLSDGALPPTWDQVEVERRKKEAFERRNLARPLDRTLDQNADPPAGGYVGDASIEVAASQDTVLQPPALVLDIPDSTLSLADASLTGLAIEVQPPTPSITHSPHEN